MTSWIKATAGIGAVAGLALAAAHTVPESPDPELRPSTASPSTRAQTVAAPTTRQSGYDRSHSPRARDRPPTLAELQGGVRVTVGGMVKSPGRVALGSRSTLAEAIRRADGPTPFATMQRVRLVRDGRMKSHELTDAERQPVRLKNGDTIELPEKMWLGR